jgi:hypothetical protein
MGIAKTPVETRPTKDQLIKRVNEEIPYVVGDGQGCIQRRAKRLKKLYAYYGIKTESSPESNRNWPGLFTGDLDR